MNTESFGSKILTALTTDQAARLVDAVFAVLDSQETDKVLGMVDRDVQETLSHLLFPTPAPKKKVFSCEKNMETWNNLWGQWQDAVLDVGDEKGKYVYQEHHWEAPDFDPHALSEDLEKIALSMLPMIEEIYATGTENNDIFIKALEEIENNIGLYPEWMADPEEFSLGSFTTRCLLKWEWLAAGSPTVFLDKLIVLEDRLDITGLERDTFIDFFISLPEKRQKEIFDHITTNRDQSTWEERLNSCWSQWHPLYHALTKKFDHKAYLDNCRLMLDQNWRYGLPLVEDLLKKGEDAEAEEIITKTFSSLLGQRGKEWHIDNSLLINILQYRYGSAEAEIIRLLEKWIGISEKFPQAKKTVSLKLQLVTYREPHQWDAVTKVFHEVNHPPLQKTAGGLVKQWSEFIVRRTLGYGYYEDQKIHDCWIYWLIETSLDETKDQKWFSQRLRKWLKLLSQIETTRFHEQEKSFFLLTGDLFEMYGVKKQYPKLYEIIAVTYGNSQSMASRQAWLRRIQGERLVPIITEFWKNNVEKFIPDPGSAHKSCYDSHARWLAAAKEMNPTSYNKIIAQWKINHKRRINLWKAIKEKGMPV